MAACTWLKGVPVAQELIRIPHDELNSFTVEVLHASGVPKDAAASVADCLLLANLSGVDTHGIVRLPHYVRRLENGTVKAQPDLAYEQRAPGLGYLDGDDGLGHVVSDHAVSKVVELASDTGIGAVSVGNSSHFGMCAYYALRMAEEGLISICLTPTCRFLIPFGGKKPFFGTNPICFGFPTDGIPVVLDMATTSVPYGKVEVAKVEGKPIPDNWARDEDGNKTTDPNQVVGLYPIAGPKGSGLAMIIDILGGVLAGMPWGPNVTQMYKEMDKPRKLGHLFIGIDVKRFMPVETFRVNLKGMLDELSSQEPAEGFDRVLYPGQLEGERRERRKIKGVPIDTGLYEELRQLGESLGVELPNHG